VISISLIEIKVNRTELFVLNTLSDYHDSDVPQSIFSNVDNSTVKKALKSLKDKGLIYKRYNSRDMRQRYIRLTAEGLEVIENETNIKQDTIKTS